MEELWAECERQQWRNGENVQRLVVALEHAGQHERAATVQRHYTEANINIIQRMCSRWGHPATEEPSSS